MKMRYFYNEQNFIKIGAKNCALRLFGTMKVFSLTIERE